MTDRNECPPATVDPSWIQMDHRKKRLGNQWIMKVKSHFGEFVYDTLDGSTLASLQQLRGSSSHYFHRLMPDGTNCQIGTSSHSKNTGIQPRISADLSG